jgi:hypothetical protein
MKRLITLLLFVLMCLRMVPSASAVEKTSDSSAKLATISTSKKLNYEVQKRTIKTILAKYNSDLTDQADSFLQASYKYDLDPYLLVSISGLESGFGRAMIDGTYNAYGWGSGTIYFTSWEDGIEKISAGLRNNYYNRGAKTVADVGRVYAASPTWAVRVEGFMNIFKREEVRQKELLSVI